MQNNRCLELYEFPIAEIAREAMTATVDWER
jgi:hypothetical protein